MTTNRRTLLAAIGLAPLGVGAEAFVTPADADVANRGIPGLGFSGNHGEDWERVREQIAQALDKLAGEVRTNRVNPCKLEVYSVVEPNNWNKHEVKLTIEYVPEAGA